MAFEQLVAEAAIKKEKESKRGKERRGEARTAAATNAAAEAPNVPREKK